MRVSKLSLVAVAAATCGLLATSANAALVHHYTLDGATTGVAIDSGTAAVAGFPGTGGTYGQFTVAGGDARVPGLIGNAVQTNDETGLGGHFNMLQSGLDGKSAGTWSLWFNLDTGEINNNSTYNALFMTRDTTFDNGAGPVTGRNMGLALRNNNPPHRLDGRINGRGTSNSTDIGQNEWVHVALTWDGTIGEQKAYINGILESTNMEAQTIGSIVTGGEWNLADDPCCGNREIAGTLDDVAVWDEVLTPFQVHKLSVGGRLGLDAPAALASNVPEPSTLLLGCFGFGLAALRRRS